ncbi:FAD binding domain-containing protein [Yoonia sp. BS5-3]|uniref:Xanthine dehydrogenase family protein subunit M n=1 Tax=Yoonia phaeophyticola TaxID=3137369 RepID=A0ABZ2V6E3_9RHOB
MMQVTTIENLSAAPPQDGKVLAGGTLLMREVNYRPHQVPHILRITDPGFARIERRGSQIAIGAGATMTDIIRSSDLAALAPAARAIGGPAIRNMATVGGNLFAPHPYGDFATALLALGAQVQWADGRTEDIEAFLSNRASARGIVAAVLIDPPRADALRFAKVSRTKPKGVSVLSIAVHIDGMGRQVNAARIAFGAMGPTPLRAKAAEAALAGKTLDAQGVAAACAACANDLAPADDALASAWYRREVAPIHLRRLLLGER